MRLSAALLVLVLVLVLAACAAERPATDDADRPDEACETSADCNEDAGRVRTCGALRICVAGRCERGAGSQLVPCSASESDDEDAGS